MPTSAVGSDIAPTLADVKSRGFTLIELLVVIAIIAIASAGVTFAMRDSSETRLEREAQRLAALLESARAQSRSSGTPVVWRVTADGFRFEGLAPDALPHSWMGEAITVRGADNLLLGPEPIIGRQAIVVSAGTGQALRIATDGIRPFTVEADTP
ncbi:MAG: type II secretion system protein GspH [Comamonadaceae bacterium]|nr:MAG: type II secretion system protein GspH [Comamonadaceae bacterium]